jgi:dimethylhistidine N-methyltransferase
MAELSTKHAHPLIDDYVDTDTFEEDVIDGLTAQPKQVPSKYLYDARGSKLFDEITRLREYYPTRTEAAIMTEHVDVMADAVGEGALLVEYGSGSSEKTRILLDEMSGDLAGYVPVDISREHLVDAADRLAAAYPDLAVQPVCADYTASFPVPVPGDDPARTVVYFPGSTIGNFRPTDAEAFLEIMAETAGPGGGLLIGVDLRKDPDVLRAAYNDEEGVTAAFNLNLLRRINREVGADFTLDAFEHEARWNDDESCIEMYLVSTEAQTVDVAGETIAFDAGETIHTEYSYKFTLDRFSHLAESAGFTIEEVWTDDDRLFSVQYAEVEAW